MTVMNIHGDYSVLQFIYKDGKINAIIDFALFEQNCVNSYFKAVKK